MDKYKKIKKTALVIGILMLSFFVGRYVKGIKNHIINVKNNSKEVYANVENRVVDWGLGFDENNPFSQPTGPESKDKLKNENAYYIGDDDKKIIYLTFDCGYENGNTQKILDVLKDNNVKAAFFVVGNFLNDNPDIIKRMVNEGHIVGNHTAHHKDITKISRDEFKKEISLVEEKFKEITGKDIEKFYRCPMGKYDTNNLETAKQLGYKTIFWSLAYADWNTNNQPQKDAAIEKLTKRIHPGAVILLHNTSKTNGEILDSLIKKYKEMDYTFSDLNELCKNSPS